MKASLSGVCERDLDLFLVEELVADEGLLAWLLERCSLGGPAVIDYSIVHSACGNNGETDVEVRSKFSDGREVVVLIENKIAASFQRRQAERYRERASDLRRNCGAAGAVTLLFAPEVYLDPGDFKHGFDFQLAYEDVLEWLRARDPDDPRLRYKELLLEAAIEKSRKGTDVDPAASTFWSHYWTLTCEREPDLNLRQPDGKSSASTFVTFSPSGLARGLSILHKFDRGFVDLQFAGWGERVGELRRLTEDFREQGMAVERATGSAAIRLHVPALNSARCPEDQADAIVAGLTAAGHLLRWTRTHGEALEAIIGS